MKLDISTQIFTEIYNNGYSVAQWYSVRTLCRRSLVRIPVELECNRTQIWFGINFAKKNGMVYVLVVHHFMRTNNESGYKYTNFHRNIQQWVQCRVVVWRPHRMLEEPGSNHAMA